ncbi:MAG: DUF1786 domain-containing protein [Deltaproteobacteria bacterium]|nr:DUF1786 domain-containing protein [Deltaproteobacteria bacterium]
MTIPQSILAIDIGGGTQDILIYEEGKPMENCAQMVLPSPTRIIAQKISQATNAGKNIFLTGNTMGGGPSTGAVLDHLHAGLKVYATELAALTLGDNLDRVRRWGIQITSLPPKKSAVIELHDVDPAPLRHTLKLYGLRLPKAKAIAVQDHGFQPKGSNRRFRFRHWQKFLASGGDMKDLLFLHPPPYMTRMVAIQRDAPGAALMDTSAAAIWGMLCDPQVAGKQEEGFIALNMGNQHTFAVLVQGERIWGVFEHHTGMMTREKLKSMIQRFRKNFLTHEEIFRDGGHGCAVDPSFSRKRGYGFIAVTGPRRHLADGLGYYMAAPYGNMMLAGCFGLVGAFKAVAGARGESL